MFGTEVELLSLFSYTRKKGWKHLAKAIMDSKSLKTIEINSAIQLKDKNWKMFMDAVIENRSLETIVFEVKSLDDTGMEKIIFSYISTIISKSCRIKSLKLIGKPYPASLMRRLIAMLSNTPHITCMEISSFIIHELNVDLFCEALQNNSALDQIIIWEEMDSRLFKKTMNTIKLAPNIKKIQIASLVQALSIMPFMEIMMQNKITHLCLSKVHPKLVSELFKELKNNNTSIKELIIEYTTSLADVESTKDLGEFLKKNNTIETLYYLPPKGWNDIAEGLKYNRSLKRISTRFGAQAEGISNEFIRVLKETKNIKHVIVTYWNDNGLPNILDIIRSNRSIRILNLDISDDYKYTQLEEICEALKINTTITNFRLKTTKQYGPQEWDLFKQLLTVNKSLNKIDIVPYDDMYISIGTESCILLKNNRIEQANNRNLTFAFLKMIALRKEVFLSMLPLEIWTKIVSLIEFTGVETNFASLLLDIVKRLQ